MEAPTARLHFRTAPGNVYWPSFGHSGCMRGRIASTAMALGRLEGKLLREEGDAVAGCILIERMRHFRKS